MLEHPVYVFWCDTCGFEAPGEEDLTCSRCTGCIERFQRVLELPDSSEGGTAFSFHALKAALLEVSGDDSIAAAAVVLSEDGVDPSVAKHHPLFASQLAALGVPPRVQEALVSHGFDSFGSICEAVESMSGASAWVEQLGLPPAAEVLLRRLWHAAGDARKVQLGQELKRRSPVDSFRNSPAMQTGFDDAPEEEAPVKRSFRLPRERAAEAMAHELALQSWQLRGDEQMQMDEVDSEEPESATRGGLSSL